MTSEELAMEMFNHQPHVVAPIVFDYFACALQNAPEGKVEEFMGHFRAGIEAALIGRKECSK